MRVLSLFDGISAGQLALQRLGIYMETYYASEIDKYTIQVTQKNFPNTIQIGDIRDLDVDKLGHIDLLIGGSSCQSISVAGKHAGIEANSLDEYLRLKKDNHVFEGESYLFWEYIRIKEELQKKNPKLKFLLENVKMKHSILEQFSDAVGVKPTFINSSLVSAQLRQRLYWTNLGDSIPQPEDKEIKLKDIIESGIVDQDKSFCVESSYYKGGDLNIYLNKSRRQLVFEAFKDTVQVCSKPEAPVRFRLTQLVYSVEDKLATLSEKGGGHGIKTGTHKINLPDGEYCIRKLTPLECERLQTFPDNFSEGISNTQRYKALGNSWTIDVIVHIFKHLLGD